MVILSSSRLQRELIWLKVVAVYAALTGFAGVYVGGHTDSGAIILDAIYSLICTMASVFLIILCQKLERPANERFHFGYYKFEPAMVAIEAILIIASCLLALVSALRDMLHPSELHNYLYSAAAFQLVVAAASGILVFCLWFASKKYDSQLLESQVILWAIDGLLSLFLGAAFVIAIWLKHTTYAWFVPYIDPVLVLVLVLVMIREPVKLFKHNFADLLDASPRRMVKERVYKIAEQAILQRELPVRIKDIRLRRAGRKLFVYLVCYADDQLKSHDLVKLEQSVAGNQIDHFDSIDVRAVVE